MKKYAYFRLEGKERGGGLKVESESGTSGRN